MNASDKEIVTEEYRGAEEGSKSSLSDRMCERRTSGLRPDEAWSGVRR
jgi:hypothetical protein